MKATSRLCKKCQAALRPENGRAKTPLEFAPLEIAQSVKLFSRLALLLQGDIGVVYNCIGEGYGCVI